MKKSRMGITKKGQKTKTSSFLIDFKTYKKGNYLARLAKNVRLNYELYLFVLPAMISIFVFSGVWQTTGWASIIYIAVLSNVDPQLLLLPGHNVLQGVRTKSWTN